LNDFLRFHDQIFVMNAYRGILRRNPDPDGLESFLSGLRSGLMTKPEILGRLRYSREGRAKKVNIKGLALNFAFQSCFKIPVLGYLFHVLMSVANFPTILRNFRAMENSAFAQLFNQHQYLGELTETFEAKTDELRENIHNNMCELESMLRAKVENRELIALHRIVIELEERLKGLSGDAREQILEQATSKGVHETGGEGHHFLEALYALFEDRFRGTTHDIRGRLEVYLPYIQRSGVGTADFPILDLGCGRGEWLELLKSHNYVARGVDQNRLFLAHCEDLDLDVSESDAVAYLRGLKKDSYGAITGFHIAEHLSLYALVLLLDESLRVLKRGGIMILETPNPENLRVGSCDFYIDPTHRNPIPPSTLHFLMEARGFVNVERCMPSREVERPGDPESGDVLHDWIRRPPDYAMIGFKG